MREADRFATDDITWCVAKCVTDCPRKPRYIRDKSIPHSFADFSMKCMAYVPKGESEERLNDAYAHGRNLTDEELKNYYDAINKKARTILNVFSNADAVKVVRCRDCRWYDPPHIQYNDGARKDIDGDIVEWVTADVCINCGGQCVHHVGIKTYCVAHNREDPDDNEKIVIFRSPDDYCSYGERRL